MRLRFLAAAAMALCALPACASRMPADVRPGHWASAAVSRALDTGLLHVQSDGLFHGDARVTRSEVTSALSALSRELLDGSWKSAGRSRPVPDSVASLWSGTNWKSEPVRRYTLAATLTRLGDYLANSLRRPSAGAAIGKSAAIPPIPPKSGGGTARGAALAYLIKNRMVQPGSPLLQNESGSITGSELGVALSELAVGVTDLMTDLGKSPDGSTNDDAYRKSIGH